LREVLHAQYDWQRVAHQLPQHPGLQIQNAAHAPGFKALAHSVGGFQKRGAGAACLDAQCRPKVDHVLQRLGQPVVRKQHLVIAATLESDGRCVRVVLHRRHRQGIALLIAPQHNVHDP
jgi:hypothetical protein